MFKLPKLPSLPPGDLLRDAAYRRIWGSILTASFGNQVMLLALPLTAVRTDRAQPYVQVVEPVGDQLQVVHKPVSLGLRGMDLTQSEPETLVGVTGLDVGSTVLKSQVGALREGMRVKYTPAAPRPASSAASAAP